jgi:ABC-2 type transport system ATP-binding protein
VVPDESNLYPELTGFENLCFCAALYGLGKAERHDEPKGCWKDSALSRPQTKVRGYSRE